MCGRFSFAAKARIIEERFDITVGTDYRPRYNCAPSQNLAVISNAQPGILSFFRWGLIPAWAKDPAISNKMINAKAETIAEKPSFRKPFLTRRCLVLSDGFYEWKSDAGKVPYRFLMKEEHPFAMAGIWDIWHNEKGEDVCSFSIITTMANEVVAPVHHRMPVILKREDEKLWLGDAPAENLQQLLVPFTAGEMQSYPIGKMVNLPANDLPELWNILK